MKGDDMSVWYRICSVVLLVGIISLAGCGRKREGAYDYSLPQRDETQAGALVLVDQTVTFSDKVNFSVELFGSWPGQVGSVIAPTCRTPLPADFELGRLTCDDNGKEVAIVAANVDQVCSGDSSHAMKKASAAPFTDNKCKNYHYRFYSFKPQLCVTLKGRQVFMTPACRPLADPKPQGFLN